MVYLELFKIIGIGVLTLICYLVIKPLKQEFAIFIVIIGSFIMILSCIDDIADIIQTLKEFIEKTGININHFLLILKIIGLGYLVEFASTICNDCGVSSLSEKIILAGKICITTLSIPIVTGLLNIIIEILP